MCARPAPFDVRSVATRFAPLVRFHPEEGYFPSSVPWYLKRVELWHRASPMHARRATTLTRILAKGQVNPTSLINQRVGRDRSDTPPQANIRPGRQGSFCLNVPDSKNAVKTYTGDLRIAADVRDRIVDLDHAIPGQGRRSGLNCETVHAGDQAVGCVDRRSQVELIGIV